jgi:hypothetical protein
MNEQPKRSRTIGILATLFVALLVAYPLSLGPIVWLDERGYFSESAHPVLEAIYLPLFAVGKYVPAIGYIIEEYISFWEIAALTDLS